MSIKLTPQDVEFIQSYSKNVEEITNALRLRILEILGIIEQHVECKFKDNFEPYYDPYAEDDGIEEPTFVFCNIGVLEDPTGEVIEYQIRLKKEEAEHTYQILGSLANGCPAEWLNMPDEEVEKEISKIIEKNTEFENRIAEFRRLRG